MTIEVFDEEQELDFYVTVSEYQQELRVSGYKDGVRKYFIHRDYQPFLFAPLGSKKDTQASEYTTIDGKPVSMHYFDRTKVMMPIRYGSNIMVERELSGIGHARHVMKKWGDLQHYGADFFGLQYIYRTFKNLKVDTSLLKEVVIDIEVDTTESYPDVEVAENAITAITLMYKDRTFAFGLGDFTPTDPKVKYRKFSTETQLLRNFLRLWTHPSFMPDVVTGWNIGGFDIPYMIRRINRVLGEGVANLMSPFQTLRESETMVFGRRTTVYTLLGISTIDYLDLYQKFTYSSQESYSLNNISWVELGQTKTDYHEYENLAGLYKRNHQLFMEYNIRDCELVWKLDDKLGFLSLAYEFAYDSGVTFVDVLGSVRVWDNMITSYLLDRKIVVPPKVPIQEKDDDFVKESKKIKDKRKNIFLDEDTFVEQRTPVGGHVKDPLIGMYDWVVSFDLQSLYPHLIMAYNISPEMVYSKKRSKFELDSLLGELPGHLTEFLRKNNLAMAANGVYYRREQQGFLPALMEDLFAKRKQYKNKMLELERQYQKTKDPALKAQITKFNNLQLAAKVKLNSAYGSLANKYFRWFSIDRAESITMSGQLVIRTAENALNDFINEVCGTKGVDYIIAVDTDSCYINFGPLVEKIGPKENIVDWIDTYCNEQIQPHLSKIFDGLADKMNCFKQTMFMKRESISDRGIFVAKKRYILNIHDNEGVRYQEPKLKLTGIEAVRSTTPSVVRDAIRESIKILMNGNEADLHAFVAKFKKEFMTLPPEDIAFPSGMNGLEKFFQGNKDEGIYTTRKGAPIHVRGATIYNRWLMEMGLQHSYSLIFDKEKVKFWHLSSPNPTGETVIAALNVLPHQFGLEEYIDRDHQFEKSFLHPLNHILTVAGWTAEKRVKKFYAFEEDEAA